MPTSKNSTDFSGFASTSVPRHLVRGFLGFGSFAGAFLLMPAVGPVSLALLPAGMVALRGCPTCWTIGLIETVSRGRLERRCVDGRCELHVASQDTAANAADSVDVVDSVDAMTGAGTADSAPFSVQFLDATDLLLLDAARAAHAEEKESEPSLV